MSEEKKSRQQRRDIRGGEARGDEKKRRNEEKGSEWLGRKARPIFLRVLNRMVSLNAAQKVPIAQGSRTGVVGESSTSWSF